MYLNLNYNSVYKDRLNRFLQIAKDTGLYHHWCERVFLENLQLKVYKDHLDLSNHETTSHSLRLEYFQYVFLVWFLGVFAGFIAFCIEFIQ